MSYKKIVPYINSSGKSPDSVLSLALDYSHRGADELYLYDYSVEESVRDGLLTTARMVSKQIDIPFFIGCYAKRLEDIKKAIYTGARAVVIRYSLLGDPSLLKEASERFGPEKLMIELTMAEYLDIRNQDHGDQDTGDQDTKKQDLFPALQEAKAGALLLAQVTLTKEVKLAIEQAPLPVIILDSSGQRETEKPLNRDQNEFGDLLRLDQNEFGDLLRLDRVIGAATDTFGQRDMMEAKLALKGEGINVNSFESKLDFSEFKVDSNGLIPVIVQDYATDEVLMLAYMNGEAYNKTVLTGRMTYYSRSRSELWRKGDTSGHVQYVKELQLDCDKDTILAKVHQVGAACHTGNRSCFFTELVKREYKNKDPFRVFQDVYEVIEDRRKNPKEGSYTNYLFDKGIDKILKKCGEESTEIVIAAKNPGAEELRYEIADYLYHLMVLMAECGLDWEDVTTELANRK